MSCPHALDDGAYVLGALSPEDRLAFERHLPDCDACARSVRELAGLPGLMARVPAATVEADDAPLPVPDTLLPALIRRSRRSARRRTWVVAGLVAAAAVVLGGAIGAATLGGTDGDDGAPSAAPPASPSAPAPTTAAPREMEPVGEEPIAVSVSMTEVGWGTRLDMTCRYAEGKGGRGGAEQPPAYAMFVTRTDGTIEQVASWKGLPGKTMQLVAATAASRADIKDVFVRAADGTEVLWLES